MPKIYISVQEWYPMMNFSGERNWKSDKEVEVSEEELASLKEANKAIDAQQEFLEGKLDD